MQIELIQKELNYKAVRSSGAGGQNVNKVSSKMVLIFDLTSSSGLTEEEKMLIQVKLKSKISQENLMILTCDEDRSQVKNKKIITQKFFELLEKALQKPKERKASKVSKAAKEKRLQEKKKASNVKENRRKPEF